MELLGRIWQWIIEDGTGDVEVKREHWPKVQYPALKLWAMFGASLWDGGSPLSRRDSR